MSRHARLLFLAVVIDPAGYDPAVDISVPRTRVLLEPDGTILDLLGVELLIDGQASEVRADGVTDAEWAAGVWLPTREVAFRPRRRP